MSNAKKIEFEIICEDILNNNKFKSLNSELHHGISRYDHSMRVAKYTYNVARTLKWKNYKEVTRAALLHDFYNDYELVNDNSYQKLSLHPIKAMQNAKDIFNVDERYLSAIKTHMFPMTKELPKYKESWLITLTNKTAATYEMLHFKLSLKLSLLIIFLYNVITIEK